MEITVKKTVDGNPICDMDEIIQTAKKKLNGTVVTGLNIIQEDDGENIVFKIKAV